jgi:hypothetical protein
MNGKFRDARRVLPILLALSTIFALVQFPRPSFALTPIEVAVDVNEVVGTNLFSSGFHLDGPDVTIWRDRSALRNLAQQANFKYVRVFSRIVEPCSRWYESSKTGTWSWSKVDLLVQRIFEVGAEPIIVLGFFSWETNRIVAPSGMSVDPQTGLPYKESWAAYCAEWVRHFKSAGFAVRFYEMVNESIFYFGWTADLTKLGYFIDFYNSAAKAMRAVNSKVQLGCDATIMKRVLDYFISYGENLDFLPYHGYGTGSLSATDAEILRAAENIYIGETTSVYGVDKVRQLYKAARGITLPVFKTENNINYYYTTGTDPRIQQMLGVVYNALTFRIFILKGFTCNIYFHFATSATTESRKATGGMGFGMVNSDNNQPWYPYYVSKMVGTNLAVSDPIVQSNSPSEDVRVVAWIHEEKLNVLLICKVDETRTVQLNGIGGTMNYSKIDDTISWKTPAIQTGKVNPSTPITLNGYTVMLLQGEVSEPSPPPTPPPTPPPSSGFEDDFESGDFGAWSGTTLTSGDLATVTTLKPYSGTYSARFRTYAISSGTKRAAAYKSITESSTVYARAYFYISEGLPLTDTGDRFTLIQFLTSNGDKISNLQIRHVAEGDRFTILSSDKTQSTSAVIPKLSTWYCLELYTKVHATEGSVRAFINGVERLSLSNINTAQWGNIASVRFGLANSVNIQKRVTVYCDAAAIGTDYVGQQSFPLWDANQDGETNVVDIATVTTVYGSTSTSANWNPIADVNLDNKVNTLDVSLVTLHYGESYV